MEFNCGVQKILDLQKRQKKLRRKTVEVIYGKQDKDLVETLKLMNWNTIERQAQIAKNIEIHKIMNNKMPLKYNELIENRDEDEIKYKLIKTKLRSNNDYNKIP